MRIAVLPIAPKSGNTTLSMLIAASMANLGRSVCITHTSPISKAYYHYFGLDEYEDRTCTPSQLVKIIQKSTVNPKELHDYCKQASVNLEVFTNISKTFTAEDMITVHESIANIFPHDIVIFDIDNIDNKEDIKRVINNCDVVVVTITQSITELCSFRENSKEFMSMIEGKGIVTVINKYNSDKMSIKAMAKAMGIRKPNGWVCLHDNPSICKSTNSGQIVSLFNLARAKDASVVELDSDILKITDTINKANFAKIKQTNKKALLERQKLNR